MEKDKNSILEKIDMQVVSVEACDITKVKKSFAGLADREDLFLDPDLMYARFIMCHEGSNANGDTFTKDVLARAQYTPRFKPIDWEHGQPMIGTILDSRYAEDGEGIAYIEAIGVIWKFIYPEMADAIKEKSITGGLRLSMECYFKDANYKYGDQIFDQEQANELGITEYVGREYMGQKVYRVFKDVIFGGVGVVQNPADKEAVFLSVAKKHAEEVIHNNEIIEGLTDEQIKAIAEIIRNTNDFNEKTLNRDTVEALTVAKFVKVFDKAKSDIVSRFNKDAIATKDQLVSEVRSILEQLLSDVSIINNDYSKGLASEDLDLEICDQPIIEGAIKEEGGSEEMDLENQEVVTDVVTEVVEEVKEVVVDEVVVEDTTDYQALATSLQVKITELEGKIQEKDSAFASLKSDFDTLNNKVEASEKEALTVSRMSELKELGIEFSEARKSKEVEKISSMDGESFADYKEFLSELLGKNVQEVVAEEVIEEVEVVEEVKVEVEKVEATDLNIETPQLKVIKPFGHLSE